MKTIEKPLPAGRWRFHLSNEIGGFKIDAVYLKGLRNRPWPLMKVDKEEYFQRHPLNPDTGEPVSEAVVVRGNPSMWTFTNGWLYLWPAPAHDWTLQLRLEPR